MGTKLKILAVAAALAAATSSVAMAQCVPGYAYRNGVCQPVQPQGYGNPVSGAVSGEAAGAARGAQTGGPVGAVVGGAIGTATGAVQGTANMFSPPYGCNAGYTWRDGACVRAR